MPNYIHPPEPGKLFALFAYVNPQTQRRSYSIDIPENSSGSSKTVYAGTWEDCMYVRIAITTDLKKRIYGSCLVEHLQAVFN